MSIQIRRIRCIATAPAGIRLVIVKVETTEPELHGLGCATFTQRPQAVITAVEQYLDPFLRGRDIHEIEDIYQSSYVSSYWRQGPVLNNALSGVDMALWDLKGKQAGMPVYQLLGGKCRMAAPVYLHASGAAFEEVMESARELMSQGIRHIRLQCAVPGQATYGTKSDLQTHSEVDGPVNPHNVFEPSAYCRLAPRLFEFAREQLGDEIELLHDIHERVSPPQALQLARDLEPYRLFFLEDAFPPEDIGYFRHLRSASTTPIAMGELFTNVNEHLPLIRERLIDFIRVHLSDIGGISMGRKLAALSEFFGVRTAWHGPGDTSPVGHAANLALDLSSSNFGIQEFTPFDQNTLDVFQGCPELRDGMLWANESPGWGMTIDETAALRFPFPEHPFNGAWPAIRRPDGSVVKP